MPRERVCRKAKLEDHLGKGIALNDMWIDVLPQVQAWRSAGMEVAIWVCVEMYAQQLEVKV